VEFARGWADQTRPRPLTAQDIKIEYRRGAPDSEVLATEYAVSLSMSWFNSVLPGYEPGDLTVRVTACIIPAENGVHQLTLAAIGRGVLTVDGQVLLDQQSAGGRDVILNPSGKLPVTFPARAEDAPSWPYCPGTEVVQLYARLADDRPFLELKAFASVHVPAEQTVPARKYSVTGYG
jgi:hypothetical protein